jgi:GH35 family endo-1,4-beta-xylanase
MNWLLKKSFVCAAFIGSFPSIAYAQLSSNPDKFLGNITTSYQIDYGNEKFYELWNQITPENETKWDQIEGSQRGKFNWTNPDKISKYAKDHNFPFKFHTLVWGSQYPNWMNNLSTEEQYEAIVEWMDAVKERYPDLQLIDVVNEAISGHAPAPYKAALGGDGKTGYDWIIKAFEMAHERWPDAILIYNDYNTFQWNTDQFIDLVTTIRNAGAPIDAYGCQSHDLTDCNLTTFKASMKKLQDALQMPMYITEYDIGTANDNTQLKQYKDQIPLMWEADYCAGITLWGYIYGKTWVTDGNSGIIKEAKENNKTIYTDRPAMTWLREYMQTDAAKTAKSPFPGMVKEASVYVKPAALGVEKGVVVPITVNARLKTKTIDHVDLYVNDELLSQMTSAPYIAEYTPTAEGRYNLKAIVTATDGTKYERLSGFTVFPPRSPFNGEKEVPGIIEVEDFDSGAEGQTFHDSDNTNEGDITNYRADAGGVDLVKGNDGCVIGYTATGEWLEYTINVKTFGTYSYEATVSSGLTGSGFNIDVIKADGSVIASAKVDVPQTGDNDWSKYQTVTGDFSAPLKAGKQTLRITINSPYVNIDKIELKLTEALFDGDVITLKDTGKGTWCSEYDLDFTDVEGIKAYTATGYDDEGKTIWLSRVMRVPAGTGIMVKGDPGEYGIPHAKVNAVYANFFKGNLGSTITINETDGDKTNYYMKNGQFVSVNGTANIAANRCYLQLPTSVFSGTRTIEVIYGDEEETTRVVSMDNGQMDNASGEWYTLSGQRISKPTKKGLYIHNGKKVVITR